MNNLTGKLRHKVDVYGRVEYTDAAGAVQYDYKKIKSVWCMITPILGERVRAVKTDVSGMVKVSETIKFTMRINAIAIKPDMYFMYKGQRYDIDYTVPFFKTMDVQEVYTQLVMENDDNAGGLINGY